MILVQTTSIQIQEKVIDIIDEMTQDWDVDDLDEQISQETQLIQNLGFTSVDFIQLFVTIEDTFQKKLGFHDLIMRDGQYIEDLSVAQLVKFIQSRFNNTTVSHRQNDSAQIATLPDQDKINPAKVAQLRQTILSPNEFPDSSTPKNPPAIFILCPPRSGSTLLRVILAGHPRLFAPPELHLLTYATLTQRKAALSNEFNNHLLNGTIRAIKQIRGCNSEQAQRIMEEFEYQQLTTKQFYHQLQQELGDRILIDKTPSYSYHLNILKRIEANFENALYIHMVRHPYGTIRSFEDAKLDQLVPFMKNSPFSRRELAELIYLISHQHILDHLKPVPAHRQVRLRFEDVVKSPQSTINKICDFFGLEMHPDMLNPYQEKNQRMTDGVQVVSKMSGDLKFHLHSGIDSNMADRWKQYHTVDFLGDITWDMAKSLGYKGV